MCPVARFERVCVEIFREEDCGFPPPQTPVRFAVGIQGLGVFRLVFSWLCMEQRVLSLLFLVSFKEVVGFFFFE